MCTMAVFLCSPEMDYVSLISLLMFSISTISSIQLEYKFIPDHCEVTNINATLVTYHYKKCIKLSRTELYLNQNFVYHMDILTDRMGQVRWVGAPSSVMVLPTFRDSLRTVATTGAGTELIVTTSLRMSLATVEETSTAPARKPNMKFTGYQFRSNEYRKGPIEFMMGMCTGLNSDQYDMPHMMANSNFRCPIYKDQTYYTYNLTPNATNMPPLIPEGQWLFEVEFIYMNKYRINSVKWYTGIQYKLRFK